MPTTPRLRWPFPAENQDPWYDALLSFFEAADLSAYASRETENLVLTGGGDVAYDAGVVSWTADLAVLAPITGFHWVMVATSVTIEDGQLLWFDAIRAPSGNTTVVPQVAAQLPLSDTAVLLAVRRGTTLYWRNGAGLENGTLLNPLAFTASTGGGGGTPAEVTEIDELLLVANATPTNIHNYIAPSLENRASIVYEVLVTMIGWGGTYATFKTLATFTRQGGTITEREVLHVSGPLRSNPAFDLTFFIDGLSIDMRVTGGADPTRWRVLGRVQAIDYTWAEA